jgi:hypothetical protein
MNAQDMLRFASREECIDSVYAQEIAQPALHRHFIDERGSAQVPARLRSEHLERERSTVAPSPMREVGLFI